jgi:transcriptional regulator with XRE-family HTH domain
MFHGMTIAERIAHWREFSKLTQEGLANALGVTVQAVRLWESSARGRNRGSDPTTRNLLRIADACGVSMAEFWGPIAGAGKRRAS